MNPDILSKRIDRRSFVKGAAGLLVPVALGGLTIASFASVVQNQTATAGPSIAKWPEPMQTRQIWLKRQETGETIVARYAENGRIRMNDYLAICKLMRDVRADSVAHIDVELMDLMFAIQSWLVAWGIDIPMVVTSGFRTPKTNSSLEGAAKNSMHIQGRAVDVRMNGVPVDYLGRLAAIFSVGGVGFYTSRNFNHLDTGNVRYWSAR